MKELSFRNIEHIILPRFRRAINEAESTEDIRKAFVYSTISVFDNVFSGSLPVEYEDVEFRPHEAPYFFLDQRLLEDEYIRPIWNCSDLQNVIARLAAQARNHYRHLEKHNEKTNAKIRLNVSM